MIRTFTKILVIAIIATIGANAQNSIIDLKGIADFEQTETAFPPQKFTRKIEVPGLIDLAIPKIDQYDKYFSGTHQFRYSWYRFEFVANEDLSGKYAVLKILKSRYNTQVIINGIDVGTYMQCNTPIECNLTKHIHFGKENELLIRLGDRSSLPKEAATGFDREKFTDIPGIWDDIFIEFTGTLRINRAIVLPDIYDNKILVKVNIENLSEFVERNTEYSEIEYAIEAFVREKGSKKIVSDTVFDKGKISSKSYTRNDLTLSIKKPTLWTCENPFLYECVIKINALDLIFNDYGNPESTKPDFDYNWKGVSDTEVYTFGMRDFKVRDNYFTLNGERVFLRGSTITLNRFFEDPERGNLPWDRDWVEKLFIKIPKSLGWNHFRVSIGLLPDFWYDLADKHGILIQNEYPMWNIRGSEEQYKKEYTDWVWSDGNHPSIVIWDALNEQKQNYIGNVLIPELRELDPTRIWDAGWTDMSKKEVNEIHWYPLALGWWWTDSMYIAHRDKFQFGKLKGNYFGMEWFEDKSAPIIVNEYGWLWLNRDGKRTSIRTRGQFDSFDRVPKTKNYEYYDPWGKQLYTNRDVYDYFLGKNATAKEKRHFQAYLLAIESEIMRATGNIAGLASFAYLSNNGGYTGDWFEGDIKELKPSEALLAQYHTHKPFAVFLDVEDARYLKDKKRFKQGEKINIDCIAVNSTNKNKSGNVKIYIVDSKGKSMLLDSNNIEIEPNADKKISFTVKLPRTEGGYMLKTELEEFGNNNVRQISRRYIIVGQNTDVDFFDYNYDLIENMISRKTEDGRRKTEEN